MENKMKCFSRGWSCLAALVLLSGCISIPNSKSAVFYSLSAVDEAQVKETFKVPAETVIAVTPVKIPEYLDRPHIVTVDGSGAFNFAQFDRWSESLDAGMTRVIKEDLSLMMPEARFTFAPMSVPVKYQVSVEVVKMEADLKKDLDLLVNWVVIDARENRIILSRRAHIVIPLVKHDHAGVVKTLGLACAQLSHEIAAAVAKL